jgi:hypothetical protein
VALPVWLEEGWGIAAIDYDNDGWLDLVAVGKTQVAASAAATEFGRR